MSDKTTQIKNQRITKNSYIRVVAIDPETNQPRPVWRADRTNGKAKQAGTYQVVRPGDTIIKVECFHDDSGTEAKLTFETIDEMGTEIPVEDGFNYRPAMTAMNAIMDEWLYSTRSEPFLPKGIGWDGVTPTIEKIKIDKAISLFPENLPEQTLKNVISAVRYTSIHAFNNVPISHVYKKDIIDVPSGDICIEVGENNRFVQQQDISESKGDGHGVTTIAIDSNTVKLLIVCYDKLPSTNACKIAITIVELF